MLEIEEETDLKGLLKTMEDSIAYLAKDLVKKCSHELKVLGLNPKALLKIKAPFPKMRYEKAIDILKKKGSKTQWGEDIGREDEKILTAGLSKPLMITHWPRETKTFYMPLDPDDERCVLNVDMQAPKGFGELFGGSQRSTDYEETKRRILAENDDPKKYKWYLDLMRYGALPHAGYGMGVARTLYWLLDSEHIRDVIPFPRFINRLKP
jgi:asparaginyl-tRNA synthetase